MTKWITFVIAAFFSLSGHHAHYRLGDIFACQPSKKFPEFYNEGERIELCCEVKSCNDNDMLSFYHEDFTTHNVAHLSETKGCSSRLTVSEAKTKNIGRYSCLLNKISLIGSTLVYVLKKPVKPEFLSKKIIPRKRKTSFVLGFDLHDSTAFDNITVYEMKDDKEGGNRLIPRCKNESITRSHKASHCQFEYGRPTFPDRNMTFVINKTRLRESVTVVHSFNPFQFIRPSRVIKLKAIMITPYSADIMFCQPSIMANLVPYMILRNASCAFVFQLRKSQGIWQQKQVMIPVQREGKCIVIKIKHLTPFTKYDARVITQTIHSKNGAEETSFTTLEAAPLEPPSEILYWAFEEPRNYSYNQSTMSATTTTVTLFVTWKHVPHDLQGGTVSYDLELLIDGQLYDSQYSVSTSYTIYQNIPKSTELTIRIWAVNNISKSANYHQLIIPSHGIRDFTQFQSHVELQGERALVYVKTPLPGQLVPKVHWCRGRQHEHLQNVVVCEEFPKAIGSLKGVNELSGIFKDTVDLTEISNNSHKSQRKEDVLVQHYSNSKLKTIIYEENLTFNVKEKRVEELAFNKMDKRPLKFFMSITKDGETVSQLSPFACYFDRYQDEVKLLYKEIVRNNKATLAWEQKCDHHSPTQYLVDRYQVSIANSRKCKPDKGSEFSFTNDVFYPTEFQLPRRQIYVCIRSSRGPNQHFYDSHYIGQASDGEKTTNWINWLVGTVLMISLIGIISCIFYYRKRWKKTPRRIGEGLKRIENTEHQREYISFTQIEPALDELYDNDSGLSASVSSRFASRSNSTNSEPFSCRGGSSNLSEKTPYCNQANGHVFNHQSLEQVGYENADISEIPMANNASKVESQDIIAEENEEERSSDEDTDESGPSSRSGRLDCLMAQIKSKNPVL